MDPEINDPLDELADRYDDQEAEEAEARAEPDRKQTEAKPDEGAENLATLAVKGFELGWKGIDSRVEYGDAIYREGREKLGPLFAKYGIGASADSVPMGDEIKAGWWLGSLAKRTWLGISAMWENDRKERNKQHGEKRESAAQEPAYPVPSEVGARQKPSFEAESPYPETWGAGGAVGHEQGP